MDEQSETPTRTTTAAAAAAGRRIVVAIDAGEESMHALSWCLNNLVSSDGKDTLILLHAMSAHAHYAVDGLEFLVSSDMVESMEKLSQERADAVIDKAKQMCSRHQNIDVETKVQRGEPRDVICEMVNKLGGDLLVMGSRGYGLIKRAFLGSVSNYCAQNANCPVLIVKKPKN